MMPEKKQDEQPAPAAAPVVRGLVRVGSRRYQGASFTDPRFVGFTSILCLTASSPYGAISPYCLKVPTCQASPDKEAKDVVFENWWQFQKFYSAVPRTVQTYSRYDKKVIWSHPAEVHLKDGKITDAHWAWRAKGMQCAAPVRYPVGPKNTGRNILGALVNDGGADSKAFGLQGWSLYNYIEARKRLYFPKYRQLLRDQPLFRQLQQRLARGENLLIIEVDGPLQEALPHFKATYNVPDDFFVNNTMLATEANLRIVLNEPKYRAGHGYALAAELVNANLD